jgi:hypothetical protein
LLGEVARGVESYFGKLLFGTVQMVCPAAFKGALSIGQSGSMEVSGRRMVREEEGADR